MLSAAINWAVTIVGVAAVSIEVDRNVIRKVKAVQQLKNHQHPCRPNAVMVTIMTNPNRDVSISMNAYNIRIYAVEILNVSIDWAAMSVRVAVDFIVVVRNAIQKMILLKQPKKQRHQPENQIIQVFRQIIGYAINALNMQIVIMVYANVEMVGLVMALNVSTIARMIQFGKMTDVYQQLKKTIVSCGFFI